MPRLQHFLFAVLVAFAACCHCQIVLHEPGYSDTPLASTPGAVASIGGTMAVAADGTIYLVGDTQDSVLRLLPGEVTFTPWVVIPGTTGVRAVSLNGATLYTGEVGGGVYSLDRTLPSPTPFLETTIFGDQVNGLAAPGAGETLLAATSSRLLAVSIPGGEASPLLGQEVTSVACTPVGDARIVADCANRRLLQVDSVGAVSTLRAGFADKPLSIAIHPITGDVYVTTTGNEILQINAAGTVETVFASGLSLHATSTPTPLAFSADGGSLYFGTSDGLSVAIHRIDGFLSTGVGITVTGPVAGSTANADVEVSFDAVDEENDPVTLSFDYSLDGGGSFTPCTAATASLLSNPQPGIPTPSYSVRFVWNSIADGVALFAVEPGVMLRVSVSDGTHRSESTVLLDVDNRTATTWTSPQAGTAQSADTTLEFDAHDAALAALPATFEYSTDGRLTWFPCAMAATSPLANPSAPIPTPAFARIVVWNSIADGVALVGATPVDVRISVTDGVRYSQSILRLVMDNSAPVGLCGDCDGNSMGPNVLDGLAAAQIAVGVTIPATVQALRCDINSSGTVDVLDALGIARHAAGIPMTLICR